MELEGSGFAVYAEFIQDQLTAEEARKTSLEQRGLAVITSSGVLATLGFGSLALAKRGNAIPMHGASAYVLFGSAIAFLVAAILAMLSNAPMRYRAINTAAAAKTLREHATDGEATARIRVTATHMRLLETIRSANNLKALYCLAALTAEVAGIALLGATVWLVALGSK